MTHQPMPQPESYGPAPSWDNNQQDQKSAGHVSGEHVGDVVSSEDPRDVFEVARALVAHGGGTGSFDLALDLVLNDVVEQARLLTGATGAAIALARNGEMVCRATAGPDAPDLGVRVETTSGLSGACLQTGKIQQCLDTESDARVDAEACRRLGVRSIMVMPLGEERNPFGILEVFSSRPHAFSDREVRTLQILARRVEENKRGAEESPPLAPGMTPSSAYDAGFATNNADASLRAESGFEPGSPRQLEEKSPQPADRSRNGERDVWTSVLGVLVIATAILLGLALGWRAANERRLRSSARADSVTAAATPASQTDVSAAAESSDRFAEAGAAVGVQPKASGGGLVVTQDGKVIFRLPTSRLTTARLTAAGLPGEKQGIAGNPNVASAKQNVAPNKQGDDSSANRIIHRVEPEYPEAARDQHIQGAVVLDVQIAGDGVVRNIAVVQGDPVLADAAVQAVRQWRYRPYAVDGKPVERQARITVRFSLPPDSRGSLVLDHSELSPVH